MRSSSPSPSPSPLRLHLHHRRVSISSPWRLHLRHRRVSVSVTAFPSLSPLSRPSVFIFYVSSCCHLVRLHLLRLKVRWLHFHHINIGNLGLTPFRMPFTVEPEACTRFLWNLGFRLSDLCVSLVFNSMVVVLIMCFFGSVLLLGDLLPKLWHHQKMATKLK